MLGTAGCLILHPSAGNCEVKATHLCKNSLSMLRVGICLFTMCLVVSSSKGGLAGCLSHLMAIGKTFADFFLLLTFSFLIIIS